MQLFIRIMQLFRSKYLPYVSIHKVFFGCNFPVFKILSSYVPKSTMVANETFKGPSSASMRCSDHFIFNPNVVNIYLPKIMSHLHLEESST